jgi:hypothetical protein
LSERKRRRTKPGFIITATGERREPRELTADELRHLLMDLMPYAHRMPAALWYRLQDLIVGAIVREGLSMEEIHWWRWKVVRAAMELVGWERSFVAASEKLAGSIFEGGERAMQESYERIERTLPPEQAPTAHPPRASLAVSNAFA